MRKEEGRQLEHEHDERPAEYERAPAATRCEPGERDEHERADRDRARARDEPGREVVAVGRADDEIGRVLLQRTRELGRGRIVRLRLPDDGGEPREHEQHGNRERGEPADALAHVGPRDQRAREREPDERDRDEHCVGRVHEREIHPHRRER